MKKNLISVMALILVLAGFLVAQKKTIAGYDEQWKMIDSLSDQQLPESALKKVNLILNQATKEKNTVQMFKATVYKMKLTLDKDPDETPQLIRDFEAFTGTIGDASDQALLYSMTADLYQQYYEANQWKINSRTEIQGTIPDDIKEWSKNIFVNKISGLLDLSLQKKDLLQKTPIGKYAELFEKNDDVANLEPTLFDFLAHRKIELQDEFSDADEQMPDFALAPADELISKMKNAVPAQLSYLSTMQTYADLLAFHQKDKEPAVMIYNDLLRLSFAYGKQQNSDLYLKALNLLSAQYSSVPEVVEVYSDQVDFYLSHLDDSTSYKRKAYDICQLGIRRFPDYKRISLLTNKLKSITQKTLRIQHENTVRQYADLKLNIHSMNISDLKINVYRVNASADQYFKFRQDFKNNDLAYPDRTLQHSYDMQIKSDPNFEQVDTTYTIKTDVYGIYEISVTDKAGLLKATQTNFVVTDFAFISRSKQSFLQNMYVLDSKSGLPLSNVTVKTSSWNWNGKSYDLIQKKELVSDKNGFLLVPYTQNYAENVIFLEKGADRFFCSSTSFYFNKRAAGNKNQNFKITLFTDRSLYRPGQTVYFKGIAYYADNQKNEVAGSENIDVVLYDVNGKKAGSKTLRTNEFGSFSGEFVLPEGGLNGSYTLYTSRGTKNIYVEEYKRPTFEVALDKPEAEIKFGEKVVLKGDVKAYAGYQVPNAKVKYRITRMPHRYCWWWNEPVKEIVSGECVADEKGKFSISFVPEKGNLNNQSWRGTYYTYMISADVTDTKGETQQAEQTVSVGDKSLFIVPSVSDMIEKRSGIDFPIYVETLNGKQIPADIQYEVYQLEESSDYVENIEVIKLKNRLKKVSGTYHTADRDLRLNTSKWNSGQYRLVLKTKDQWGNEVKTENEFIIYSDKDKKPAVKSYTWLEKPKTTCVVGENALIRFGTSTTNTMVLYEIMQGDQVLSSQWINMSNKIMNFKIPFKESYGSGVNVLFTFMKDGQLFQTTVPITRKTDSKKLTPKFSVFRNKLLPGEKAEWTITIPELKQLHEPAEVLAGMYDASLDAIRPHDWNFNPLYNDYIAYSPVWIANSQNLSEDYSTFENPQSIVPDQNLNELNWFGLTLNDYPRVIRIRGAASMKNEGVLFDMEVLDEDKVVGYAVMSKQKAPAAPAVAEVISIDDSNSVKQDVQVRTNFNETAFFYPQLRTDENGQLIFSFTAPESLTRWNVKMLAHTKDLYFGSFDTTAVTQKDLMVQMNLPRFVRRSDKMVLSANVINLTNQALSAQVRFELIDPATNKPVALKNPAVRSIALAANATQTVTWDISEFSPYDLVICKVVALSGNFSDGEQKYLPVLPDQVTITESQPLIIRANQTRQFNFESLIKNVANVKTTNVSVEFSSNPAWYAVQALPSLATPDEDNALSLMTAFYANTLAGFIANSNPKIAQIMDQWKKLPGSREALLSNLDKNQELKNMLLEETPWVTSAQNETEQKKRIALLFDLNMQKDLAQKYMTQLQKLQLSNGAFSWYEGMPESRYITQEIVLNIGRLARLTGQQLNDQQKKMIENAVHYLDLAISKDFESLKKNNKNYLKDNCTGNMQLFYLHARSEYPEIPVPDFAQEALKYYTAQSEKYWTTYTLYGKAMMAVVAERNGKHAVAEKILKSLKENALQTDEMGMYWAKNISGYFWNERPVAVQAAIIEAFAEVTKNKADVDELKIWLLKQKQTQIWDSPVATVDAVYALLLQGSDWLSSDNTVDIKVGDQNIEQASKEAGTGYFKSSIPASEVHASTGKITVSSVSQSGSSSIGWGAMYWQYEQEQSKVSNSSSGLKVTKQLFVKTGNTMIPVTQTTLKTGDKVVTRLVVTADRNMDFVALKDLRAACFEPVDQRSGSQWKEGVCYYQTTKDASTQFFFSTLPKGTYVFEYELWVNNSGEYTSGVTSIQCQYAPEFVSYAGGEILHVK